MASNIHVDIVSAEREIFSGEADMVFAPGEQGELGIAPRHAPLLTRMKPGVVRVQSGGEEQVFYVSGGILEIQPHTVTVLSDTAQRAADIDEAAAQEAKRKAEEALANQSDDLDVARAQAELLEAVARLRALEKIRKNTR
ncbi:MAG TPA: F0F1 ATP synthase subunit epsilon [Gammaproteobacteria bacterium]|jgi:F-type H+-transporting ATPase subunit epsilon|nr:F0F1 ATP synthase subunit epsilon [Gammaproteobacteria bacterium]